MGFRRVGELGAHLMNRLAEDLKPLPLFDHVRGEGLAIGIVVKPLEHPWLSFEHFGMDELPPRQQRYDMADEYMQVVDQLWKSWDPDAVVLNRETGTYADYTKVRPINFVGKYYKVRGPLNTA